MQSSSKTNLSVINKAKRKRLYHIYMGKLAKYAKRHDDVLYNVRKIVRTMRNHFRNTDLTVDEKLLFNTAYKNILMLKRR